MCECVLPAGGLPAGQEPECAHPRVRSSGFEVPSAAAGSTDLSSLLGMTRPPSACCCGDVFKSKTHEAN